MRTTKDDPNGILACEHGRQRKKCEVCQLIEAESDNARLTAELARAKAKTVYCPTCKACGEPGCCPPEQCKHLVCLHGSNYAKTYTELGAELAEAVRERDEAVALLRPCVKQGEILMAMATGNIETGAMSFFGELTKGQCRDFRATFYRAAVFLAKINAESKPKGE